MTPREMLAPQPAPLGGHGSVTDDAIAALRARWPLSPLVTLLRLRREQGRERYGVELRYQDGRDARADLLQELLDAVLYAQQAGFGDVRDRLVTLAEDVVYRIESEEVRRG